MTEESIQMKSWNSQMQKEFLQLLQSEQAKVRQLQNELQEQKQLNSELSLLIDQSSILTSHNKELQNKLLESLLNEKRTWQLQKETLQAQLAKERQKCNQLEELIQKIEISNISSKLNEINNFIQQEFINLQKLSPENFNILYRMQLEEETKQIEISQQDIAKISDNLSKYKKLLMTLLNIQVKPRMIRIEEVVKQAAKKSENLRKSEQLPTQSLQNRFTKGTHTQ